MFNVEADRDLWRLKDISELEGGDSTSLPPHEKAKFHEKKAKQHYLRDDYTSTVTELDRCVKSGGLDESKELKMRVFNIQCYRRFGKIDLAWEELKKLDERFGASTEPFVKNLLLNEREIMEKRTVIESNPTRLTVRPTGRCSIHCIMCTFWHEEPWDMPQKTLDEIVALYPTMEDILWQGGEVFEMKREVFEQILLNGIPYPRMLQNIITNGLNIDERWADVLVRCNVHMRLSIDGSTKEVYEKIRVLASFDNILKSVKNLNYEMARQKRRIWLSLHFVTQRYNYHQIEDIVDFANDHGFNAVAFSPMEGESYKSHDIFNYGDAQTWGTVQTLRARAKEKALKYGIYFEDNLPPPPQPEEKKRVPRQDPPRFPLLPMPAEEGARYTSDRYDYFCLSPWKNMILRNGGGVLPNWHCGERYIGNVHDSSVLEIWNGEPMQRVRKAVVDKAFGGVCRAYCLSGALSEPWKHHMEWYWS